MEKVYKIQNTYFACPKDALPYLSSLREEIVREIRYSVIQRKRLLDNLSEVLVAECDIRLVDMAGFFGSSGFDVKNTANEKERSRIAEIARRIVLRDLAEQLRKVKQEINDYNRTLSSIDHDRLAILAAEE